MFELVKVQNLDGKLFVSSRDIAKGLEKEHRNVLAKIREVLNEQEFKHVNYKDSKGEQRPEALVTKDGFILLCMNYTGYNEFKRAYINKFNEMEAALKNKLPQNYKEALTHLLVQIEKNEKLIDQIERDKPKVNFANSIETSKDSIFVGELAKLSTKQGVKIGQNRLFQKLRDEGYLMKNGSGFNLPTQKSIELKVMEIRESVIQADNGEPRIYKTAKITGKGQVYFINKIKEWYGNEGAI